MVKYKGQVRSSFDTLVASYSRKELASPTRSTVPLLAYWSELEGALPNLAQSIQLALPSSMDMCFEYSVPVQGGKGNASYTDLMLCSSDYAAAIEAKYTEPKYETVQVWLRTSDNRRQVLTGWLKLINNTVGANLTIDDVTEWTYQVIHRTASVCHLNAKRRIVIYQYFGPTNVGQSYYESQLAALSKLIGKPGEMDFYLMCIPLKKHRAYQNLENSWRSGERDLSEQVKKGLIDRTLLDFVAPTVLKL